jgi:hypothetical protein
MALACCPLLARAPVVTNDAYQATVHVLNLIVSIGPTAIGSVKQVQELRSSYCSSNTCFKYDGPSDLQLILNCSV